MENEKNPAQPINLVEPEEHVTKEVSIDDILEGMELRPRRQAEESGRSSPPILVGELVELSAPDEARRALVRWRDEKNQSNREEWLSVVRGLELNLGDAVLLTKPDNWPNFLITDAFERLEDSKKETKEAEEAQEALEIERPRGDLEARVDGQRVELEGKDEIVLRCGKASIVLRRNGRVVIRGTYVETRSKGTNRIKGGSVQIN